MTKLTPSQRKALTSARDHGTPWRAFGHVWRPSTAAMIDRLVALGLLVGHDQPQPRGSITQAGLDALR